MAIKLDKMAFKNPWGKGSPSFNRWNTNKWSEGGEYHDRSAVTAPVLPSGAPPATVQVFIKHGNVPADHPDHDGLVKLVQAADSIIPDMLKRFLEISITEDGYDELSIPVFDAFDRLVTAEFRRNYFPVQTLDLRATNEENQSSLVVVVAIDFIAALRIGSDMGVRDSKGNSNTIKRNYTVTESTNEFGLPSQQITTVGLYDTSPTNDSQITILKRTFNNYYISLKHKNYYIFTNFTIGEITPI